MDAHTTADVGLDGLLNARTLRKSRLRARRRKECLFDPWDTRRGRWYHPDLLPVGSLDGPAHGTGVGYREWCCRCTPCTRAA